MGAGGLVSAARRAPEHGLHPRDELARAERLGEVVVGAGLEAQKPVGFLDASRHHDDRDSRSASQRACDLQAVDPGQAEVKDDEIGAHRSRRLQSLRSVGRDGDLVTGMPQIVRRDGGDPRLVLDHQYRLSGHKPIELTDRRQGCCGDGG